MPPRKLTPADLDDLRRAYEELTTSRPRRIVRLDDDDNEVTITTIKGICEWKGISEPWFHELRARDFVSKRGPKLSESDRQGDLARSVFEMSIGQINQRDKRIVELEARVAELEQQLKEKR